MAFFILNSQVIGRLNTGVAVEFSDRFLYATSSARASNLADYPGNLAVFRRDPTPGGLTSVQSLPVSSGEVVPSP